MTGPQIARPGDPDLDCHLTVLRLIAVEEAYSDESDLYAWEAVLRFSAMDAGGWYELPKMMPPLAGFSKRAQPDGSDIAVSFGLTDPDQSAAAYATLHSWLDRGAWIEMTSAPGKSTLLRSGTETVVIPGSEAAVAR